MVGVENKINFNWMVMKKRVLSLMIWGMLFYAGCSSSVREDAGDAIRISTRNCMIKENMKSSEYLRRVKYVPLETDSVCILGNIDKIKSTIKGWRLGDYFRQFSIVAAGIIVTFWGSDRITEYSRQKEVRAAMQLVAEELEYNRKELRNIKHLLDIDRNMSSLLIKHKMDISGIPRDTLTKYDKLFNNMNELSYRTDALDVLKGSSLMQYISDKRLLQDVLQIYFELGKRKKDIGDYYAAKTDVLMGLAMSKNIKFALETNDSLLDQVSFLISNDEFVNFVIMVPGFLYWNEFDELDEMLDKQIQTLKAKYK